MANIKVSDLENSTSSIVLIKDEDEFFDSVSGAVVRALDVRGGAAVKYIPIKPIIVGIIYDPGSNLTY